MLRSVLLKYAVGEYTIDEAEIDEANFGLRLVAIREPEPIRSYVRVSSIVFSTPSPRYWMGGTGAQLSRI